jgi:hypothetical protein
VDCALPAGSRAASPRVHDRNNHHVHIHFTKTSAQKHIQLTTRATLVASNIQAHPQLQHFDTHMPHSSVSIHSTTSDMAAVAASASQIVPLTVTYTPSSGSVSTATVLGQVLNNGATNWIPASNGAAIYLGTASVQGANQTVVAGSSYYATTGPAVPQQVTITPTGTGSPSNATATFAGANSGSTVAATGSSPLTSSEATASASGTASGSGSQASGSASGSASASASSSSAAAPQLQFSNTVGAGIALLLVAACAFRSL